MRSSSGGGGGEATGSCGSRLETRFSHEGLRYPDGRARRSLAYIGGLFRVERAAGAALPEVRLVARRTESKAIVDAFFTWCEAEAGKVLDETPTAKAIGYALDQRVALQRFLDDGRLRIHNNSSERTLRREVVGRKNWLFVGSDDATEINAAFVS